MKKTLVGIGLGAVAGVIDVVPMIMQKLTWDARNKFIEILYSLKPGGTFYFAPGFEIAEDIAEKLGYEVFKKKIDEHNYATACRRL